MMLSVMVLHKEFTSDEDFCKSNIPFFFSVGECFVANTVYVNYITSNNYLREVYAAGLMITLAC